MVESSTWVKMDTVHSTPMAVQCFKLWSNKLSKEELNQKKKEGSGYLDTVAYIGYSSAREVCT